MVGSNVPPNDAGVQHCKHSECCNSTVCDTTTTTATSIPTVPTPLPKSTNKIQNNFSFFNVQGLNPKTVQSKVPYIKERLLDYKQLFMGLTETWLSNHIEAELHIDGYTLFRQDRNVKRKSRYGRDSGGAAIYMKDDMAATFEPVVTYSDGKVEVLCIFSQAEKLFLGVVYRPPDNPLRRSTSVEFQKALKAISSAIEDVCRQCPTPDIVIGGGGGGFQSSSCKLEERQGKPRCIVG